MILRLAALLLLVTMASAGASAGAQAAPVVVDGRAVELPVPSGYCPIDRDRAPDARLWEAMRALQEQDRNRLLAWFAACGDLERWRGDPERALERHAMVLARMDMPAYSRRAVVDEMVRGFDRGQGVIGDGSFRMQLLETRDDALLAVMNQEVAGATGARRIIAVITFTALNSAPLTTNFYAPDTGPEALQPVREAALTYLGTLIAANPEPRSSLVWPTAAIAAALVALAGGAYWRLRRRRDRPRAGLLG